MTDTTEAVRLLAETVAQLNQSAAHLRAALKALEPEPAERLVTPAEMEVGGWVRFPGTRTWRQITTVVAGHPSQCLVEYRFGGVTYSQDCCPWDTLPYHTDAEMAAICDAQQAHEDDAADRLDHAVWLVTR